MHLIPLSNNYTFAIEPCEKRLRLIVFKNDEEYVCRKENVKQLNQFLNTDEAHAFKCWSQLLKPGWYCG